MLYGIEPKTAGHFFLREVGASHGRDGDPSALGETVRGLASGGSTDDLGLLFVNPATGVTPQKLLVTVTAKLCWQTTCIRPKLLKDVDQCVGYQVFEAVDLDVLGSVVNKEKCKVETQFSDRMAVYNIQVNLVQVALGGREGFVTLALVEVGKFSKRRAWFATLNKLGVL